MTLLRAAAATALLLLAQPARAADCGGDFGGWMGRFFADAKAAGISTQSLTAALGAVQPDPAIIRRDRGQGVFNQTFLQFAGRMVSADRMARGPKLLAQHAAMLAAVEKAYGVPPEVIVAFWGLETDFGADKGKYPILTSLVTLAHDCRRADYFRNELMGALHIVQKGDLTPSEMVGDWAGEAGHLMMSPSEYDKWGVDFDGDGRRNVIASLGDAFASAAAFLQGSGWKRGEPWLQEVKVPAEMAWAESGLDKQHSRAEWVKMGVTARNGSLPADGMPASLHLPMGRNGPAFLAYDNFQMFLKWNKAIVYSTTAAYYANRLKGAPTVGSGNAPVTPLTPEEVKELQSHLVRLGLSADQPDGRVGTNTRLALRQAQIKLGLPADGYPDAATLTALRAR